MVNALIQLDDNTNRVLDVVKAKYRLRDKGQAIQLVVSDYIEKSGDYELRPEFIRKIEKIEKEKGIAVKNFAKRYGLK